MPGPGKKPEKRSGGGKKMMSQMGFSTDMSMMMGGIGDDGGGDDDDDDLEAELLALTGPDSSSKKAPKKRVNPAELERMVAASMRDIPSDGEMSDVDEDELMAELAELEQEPDSTPATTSEEDEKSSSSSGSNILSLLEERHNMYIVARSNTAETSKIRRIDRGIKTIDDMIKKAKTGRSVDEGEIPPPISTAVKSPSQESVPLPQVKPPSPSPIFAPTLEPTTVSRPPISAPKPQPQAKPVAEPAPSAQPAPAMTASNNSDPDMLILMTRRDQYKTAALEAKSTGDIETAKNFIRIFKQFEGVIEAKEKGNPIDLSLMPPPPSEYKPPPPSAQTTERSAMQGSTNAAQASAASTPEETDVPAISEEAQRKLFQAPESAGSVMEALQQRHEKYKTSADQSKAEGNGSKARRMGRIAKQYEDAIKCHKAGKPVDYDDLPCPPGFPPIPVASSPTRAPRPAPVPVPVAAPAQPPSSAQSAVASSVPTPGVAPTGPVPQPRPRPQRQMSVMSRAEQQCIFLQERQLGFKKIALKAKQNGQVELAKKYLRQAMGFNQMIEASQSGLPVDLTKIPALPGAKSAEALAFVPNPTEGDDTPKGDRNEIYKKLEQELIQQIRTATANSERFTNLGDVSTATKFDKMSQNARKDLDALKNAFKHGDPVPRFHYETKSFSIVQCCPELGDNDLEIVIVRGVNLGLPSDYEAKDLDTYVKYEFPYPTDEIQKGQTDACKGTINPEYNQAFKVQITRKSRGFLRLLKQASKPIKLEVYYKRGFFKGDKLLGTANVKMIGLETHCILHDSHDLVDKHKSVGGKLEVKLRVRDPFVSKQVEEVTEKWLFIDAFERVLKPNPAAAPRANQTSGAGVLRPAPAPRGQAAQQTQMKQSPSFTSMDVLKYEKKLLDEQIQKYKGRLKKPEEDALNERGANLLKQIKQTQQYLHEGGTTAWHSYASSLQKSQATYMEEAKMYVQQSQKDKAQVTLNKKKFVDKELEAIQAKFPRK